jgi:hypothetical protein
MHRIIKFYFLKTLFAITIIFTNSYSQGQIAVFKGERKITESSLYSTVELYELKAKTGWESEQQLELAVLINKKAPYTFIVQGAGKSKRFKQAIVRCTKVTTASIVRQLAPRDMRRRLYVSQWRTMLDTGSLEDGLKEDLIIESEECEETSMN